MRKIITKAAIAALFFQVFLFFSCANSKTDCGSRFISVNGKVILSKMPDQVLISFSLFSKDKNLNEAKSKNDASVKRVKELFAKYNIEQKNISIEQISINPRYRYQNDGTEIFLSYEAVQNISVLLTDISNYDKFLTELLDTGVERVFNAAFSVGDMNILMEEARADAIKAAESKAASMCSAASNGGRPLTVGKIISITEQNADQVYRRAPRFANNVYAANESAIKGDGEPMGQVEVTAEVNVVFSLVD